jgi:hypothetical protein
MREVGKYSSHWHEACAGMNSFSEVVVPSYVIKMRLSGCHSILANSLNLSASVHNVYNKTVNNYNRKKNERRAAYSCHLASH